VANPSPTDCLAWVDIRPNQTAEVQSPAAEFLQRVFLWVALLLQIPLMHW